MIPQERRATPSEPESLALIVLQQKGLIKAAEAAREEAREAHEAARDAHTIAVASAEMLAAMREWQERHAVETRPLIEVLPDLLQITQSLRWLIAGKAVLVWLVGSIIAIGALVASAHTMWETFMAHRGP
jgi:hypothetical protein